MSNSRFAILGLACIFANACTVVVQPTANQPQPDPPVTEQEADVGTVEPLPAPRDPRQVPRDPRQVPKRRPANPAPDTERYEPESPPGHMPTRGNGLNLGIPPGHLPGPGECRVWVDGTPPGRQARSRPCEGILATAPLGSWILYRPAQYERQVRVRYLHSSRQMVTAVRAFDVETGTYLRDFALDEDDNNMGPIVIGAGRPNIRQNADTTRNRGNSGDAPGQNGTDRRRGKGVGDTAEAADATGTPASRRTDRRNVDVAAGRVDTSNGGRTPGNDVSISAQRTDSTRTRPTAPRREREDAGDPLDDHATVRPPRGLVADDTSANTDVRSSLGIDARQFPDAGQCRLWVPGLPPGRQTRQASCEGMLDNAPAGSWILRRSADQPDVVVVDYVDEETAGVVVRTSAFDATTGAVRRPSRRRSR